VALFFVAALRRAKELQLNRRLTVDGSIVIFVCALGCAYLSHSLYGGLVGGALVAAGYYHLKRAPKLLYLEPILFGGLAFMVVARTSCALTHDHPGKVTTFWGAVRGWPDGATRHDLGLYELVFLLLLTGLFYLFRNRRPFPGFHLAICTLAYAAVRLGLDFLRQPEAGPSALIPEFCGVLALLVCGLLLLLYGLRSMVVDGREGQEGL